MEHLCSKIDVFTFDFLNLIHEILKCTCAYRLNEFFTCEIVLQKGGGECLYFWIFACVRWQYLFKVQLIYYLRVDCEFIPPGPIVLCVGG